MVGKKIVINLIPKKYRAAKPFLAKISFYLPLATISAIVSLVLVLLVNLIALKKAHTYSIYKENWKEWEEKAKILTEVKGQINALITERDQLFKVLAPNYKIAPILGDIFSALPKNIWFQSFSLGEEGLDIEGSVVKWNEDYLTSLDKFIKSLRTRGSFSAKFGRLQIEKSQKADFNNIEVLKFIIACRR